MQTPSVSLRTLSKELMDSVAQDGGLVRQTGLAIQINDKSKSCIARQVLCPADDEVLSSGVQILIAKWGWVNGVEELLQFADVYLDHGTLGRDRITRAWLIVSH